MPKKKIVSTKTYNGGRKVPTSAEKPSLVRHGAMASEKASPSIKKTNMIG